MRTYLFPGQGSQSVGMGTALMDADATARAVWEEVDEALGLHLTRLMRDGPADELTLTANAQPAIMANAIATLRAGGVEVDRAAFVAGHSLGEYTALCAAGSFDLATTARLLRRRGEAMQAAVPVGEGAMAVLLGGSLEDARVLAEAAAGREPGGEVCVVANDNDPTQVVLSGHAAAIERAIGMARDRGFRRAMPLPVSAPFHSPLMAPAADVMRDALGEHGPRAPCVPLMANVTAAPVRDGDEIAGLLVDQVTGTVRWRESVLALAEAGVTEVVELGAKVLGPMVKRTAPDLTVTSVVTPGDLEGLA